MAPSRTKVSRKARRVRRTALNLTTELEFAEDNPSEYTPEELERLRIRTAKAQARVAELPVIGRSLIEEIRAEGYDADEAGDEGEGEEEKDEAPARVKKAKASPKAEAK